jgi:hypothetical protein
MTCVEYPIMTEDDRAHIKTVQAGLLAAKRDLDSATAITETLIGLWNGNQDAPGVQFACDSRAELIRAKLAVLDTHNKLSKGLSDHYGPKQAADVIIMLEKGGGR